MNVAKWHVILRKKSNRLLEFESNIIKCSSLQDSKKEIRPSWSVNDVKSVRSAIYCIVSCKNTDCVLLSFYCLIIKILIIIHNSGTKYRNVPYCIIYIKENLHNCYFRDTNLQKIFTILADFLQKFILHLYFKYWLFFGLQEYKQEKM